MPAPSLSPAARKALALIRASGNVIVDSGMPTDDLVALAAAAAEAGVRLTIRHANLHSKDVLAGVAAAGRGRVTFDLSD